MLILPDLRSDLVLNSTSTFINGQETYLFIDPIKDKYYRINSLTLTILKHWQAISSEQLVEIINANESIEVFEDDIKMTLDFLAANELIIIPNPEALEVLIKKKKHKNTLFTFFLHYYLFFKIPLVNPDKFLRIAAPYVLKIFTRSYFYFLLIIFFVSAYLISDRWSEFTKPYDYLFTFTGFLYLTVSMAIVKTIHELGHAFTARYYGCYVGSIGVAFMVLFPILYTDTSDSWRLKNRYHRLHIDLAGIISELHLVVWCLLLWNLVENPVVKSILVYIINIGLISTLLINANPLMRYDGYYAFSSFVNIDNLQPQGFALARWKLRYWLTGLNVPAPFYSSKKNRKLMIIYAYTTWLYRFFLFLGIAFLVYHFFIKIVGIFLMLIELYFFIFSPIISEIKDYMTDFKQLKFNYHILLTSLGLLLILFLLLFPWRQTLVVPGVLTFEQRKNIYTQLNGYATSIPYANGQHVVKDSIIYDSYSPELIYQRDLLQVKIKQLQVKLLQQRGKGDELGYKISDQTQLDALNNELENTEEELKRLVIKAPFDGVVFNQNTEILSNRWYKEDTFLMSIINNQDMTITAFIPENALDRVKFIKDAYFLSDNANTPAIPLKLISKPIASSSNLDSPYLASTYAGPLAIVGHDKANPFQLKDSIYEYRFSINNDKFKQPLKNEERGVVKMTVQRQSFLKRMYLNFVAILLKESGF